MDARSNPYNPGAGTRPPALTGRDGELERFDVLLARLLAGSPEQSMLVTGLRGVGKTVLLNTFEDMALATGALTTFGEILPETDLPNVIGRSVRRMLEELKPSQKMRASIAEAFSRLEAFSLRDPSGFELTLDLKGGAGAEGLTEDFTEMLLQLGHAALQKGRAIVFLFDEFQFLKPGELGPFVAGLHRVTQKGLPVICVGAGLPQLPRLVGEAKSYAERLFSYTPIGALEREAAAEALTRPAETRGAAYEDTALKLVLDLTEGYPYFIQEYGRHVWNQAEGSPIRRGDVEAAAERAQRALDEGFFQVRAQRVSDRERRFMRAMAELGVGPYRTGAIAEAFGASGTPEISAVRRSLLERGLVYSPRYGYLDFTVPRFDDFMRRTYPFRTPQQRRG